MLVAIRLCLLLVGCLGLFSLAEAVNRKKPLPASASALRQLPAAPETRRSRLPVATAVSTAPGQEGYVHYFLITHPDDTLEYHVGIELPDQRIAWSFPGLGVAVSPFIASGSVEVNGVEYGIQHLYAIRPFPDDARMKALQESLTYRVAQWIDDETPYCAHRTPNGPFCLSCGDFVVRILFPGRVYHMVDFPRDFFRAPSGSGPSTDDLLLYLVGLNELTGRDAALKRVAALSLPPALREDLSDLLAAVYSDAVPASELAKAARATRRKARANARPSEKVVQEPPPRKKL